MCRDNNAGLRSKKIALWFGQFDLSYDLQKLQIYNQSAFCCWENKPFLYVEQFYVNFDK